MIWETVIGLEVHTELSTKSKLFCSCSAKFGAEPNTQVCPVCAGMPGTLPVLNRAPLEYAIRLGLALGCQITKNCKFDRKNYFYPDLPKAYQISQLYSPICKDGHLEISSHEHVKKIGIREIHIEEDAGKLLHSGFGETQMDYNRCGVPLLEIVTCPDFSGADEVISFLEKLREILLYLGVSDCKMQEGSLRADVNLSTRRAGEQLGVRTEMKNLNSLKAIGRAIEYEASRQIEILQQGGKIEQETLRWDDDRGESFGMRSKEDAHDYRYFPEPDLLLVCIDDSLIEGIRRTLPELAHQKRSRYISEYGLSDFDASVITVHKNISDLFESVSMQSENPKESANLITGEIMRLMNQTGTLPENLKTDGRKLAKLVSHVLNGNISRNAYKQTIEAVFMSDVDPDEYIALHGLMMQNDSSAVEDTVRSVIADNESAVSDYRTGKNKAFGFLMGRLMRELGNSGNPELARKALKDALDNP